VNDQEVLHVDVQSMVTRVFADNPHIARIRFNCGAFVLETIRFDDGEVGFVTHAWNTSSPAPPVTRGREEQIAMAIALIKAMGGVVALPDGFVTPEERNRWVDSALYINDDGHG
jgi:hypothetical protein